MEKDAHDFLGGDLSGPNFLWREVHTIGSNCVQNFFWKWLRSGEESDHSSLLLKSKTFFFDNFEPYPTNELVLSPDGESNTPQWICFGHMALWPAFKSQKYSFQYWPLTPAAQKPSFYTKTADSEKNHGRLGPRVTDDSMWTDFIDWWCDAYTLSFWRL